MPETEKKTEIVSAEEIAALNEARTILKRIESGQAFGYSSGLIAERCDHASNAIFRAIAGLNIYGSVEMTDAQIHNRPGIEES